ncbi:hypothetical protein ASD63_21030 [Ensifer sp. Root558]|nr:hypothetical protein ASD63_21030 [Ensifer sp. Root558]
MRIFMKETKEDSKQHDVSQVAIILIETALAKTSVIPAELLVRIHGRIVIASSTAFIGHIKTLYAISISIGSRHESVLGTTVSVFYGFASRQHDQQARCNEKTHKMTSVYFSFCRYLDPIATLRQCYETQA